MSINELIKERRTIRKFKQTPLEGRQLEGYVNAARLAPSAANLQPLKYVIVTSAGMNDRVFETVKWAGYLKGEYNPKQDERPTGYIVVCVDNNVSRTGYEMDVGAAVENIILSALEDGVGACWIGSVERPKLKRMLGIEESIEISCVVALGYPSEQPKEATVVNDDIKYYLEDGVLNVPKRKCDEIIIKRFES